MFPIRMWNVHDRVLNDQVSVAVFCLVGPVIHTCVSTYFKHFMRQLLPSGESACYQTASLYFSINASADQAKGLL